jgi:hypothetical protein
MNTVYYRNRIAREMPHSHRCNTCGVVEDCPAQPCYRPVNAPFSLCDPCRDREIIETLALVDSGAAGDDRDA